MKAIKVLFLAGAVALAATFGGSSAKAGFGGRQYYGGWHHTSRGYWYSNYYYKPYASFPSYCYNYAIQYPKSPRFVYYFNPYKHTYWGRFDMQTKGYSLLAEKDRAGQLKDIPETKFPAEGPLPPVPDTKDQVQLQEPPDLPAGENIAGSTATAAPGDAAPPATPAAAPATPNTPAAPAAPADKNPPADPPVDLPDNPAPTGSGAVPPAEPVGPAPGTGAT